MNVSFIQSAAALNANARWQETIAENLAAASTPGFKKQDFSVTARPSGILPAANVTPLLLPQGSKATNFQPGEFRHTGVKTDVALEGPGFLSVQLPDGGSGYTRDGELSISPSGQLVSKEGYPVIGTSGPIQLDLNNPAPISISSTGQVSQGADVKGTLSATEFSDPNLLTPISRGYFLATHPNLRTDENSQTSFRQGFIETANTSAASEMAQLIAAMRMYEANQRVLQTHDDRMARVISEIGLPS